MRAVDMVELLCNCQECAEAAITATLQGDSVGELHEEIEALCGWKFLIGIPRKGRYVLFYSDAADMPINMPDFISVLDDGRSVLFYRMED